MISFQDIVALWKALQEHEDDLSPELQKAKEHLNRHLATIIMNFQLQPQQGS